MDEFKRMSLGGGPSVKPASPREVYYIKNKDRVLAEFEWEDEMAALLKDYGLPKFPDLTLTDWLSSRTPPKHRENMDRLLSTLGLSSTKAVIDYSKGLALTDSLWVTTDRDQKWSAVSLFSNSFDEVIAHIAFDGGLYGRAFSTTSPEFGTNGMLAKCWVRDDGGQISLIKTGTTGASNAGNEPYSEVLAHQVLTRLGYTHVPYEVCRYRGKLVSKCPLFTGEDTWLVPIYMVEPVCRINTLLEYSKVNGISEGFAQYLIFDYLSWNTDRHAGNIGVLLDGETYEVKGMAPIFDNGVSMLNYWNGTDDIHEYVTRSTPALYSSFEMGAKIGKKILGRNHNVGALINFKFDRSKVPGYPDSRIDAIEEFLQWRVATFMEF